MGEADRREQLKTTELPTTGYVRIQKIIAERTHEDTGTHAELALYIDGDFCGNFVVPRSKLSSFFDHMARGFGDKLSYRK